MSSTTERSDQIATVSDFPDEEPRIVTVRITNATDETSDAVRDALVALNMRIEDGE
jgi:hypothetical protein